MSEPPVKRVARAQLNVLCQLADSAVCVFSLASRHWPVIIIGIGLLLHLSLLGAKVFGAEEGRRAVQAMAIVDGGSWWRLEAAGLPYIGKPPLLPWLISLSSFLTGGINEWAIRLPPVVAVVVAALVSGKVANMVAQNDRNDLAALAAGLAFLLSPLIIERARVGETDTMVTACLGLAFLAFLRAYESGKLQLSAWIGIGSALTATALAKGPIPLAFVAVPIFVTLAADRAWSQIAAAVATFVLASIPLGLWAYANIGEGAMTTWANETRVSSVLLIFEPKELARMLYLNQLPRWVLSSLPWITFAVAYVWHRRHQVGSDARLRALLLYAVPVSLVLLVWPAGRGRYALPAVVPTSVLAGVALAYYWDHAIVRRLFVAAVLLLATVQIGNTVFFAGRSAAQRAFRADVAAIGALLDGRPGGRLLLVGNFLGTKEFNLVAYYGRRLQVARPMDLECPAPTDILLAAHDATLGPQVQAAWQSVGHIGSTAIRTFLALPVAIPCSLGGRGDTR